MFKVKHHFTHILEWTQKKSIWFWEMLLERLIFFFNLSTEDRKRNNNTTKDQLRLQKIKDAFNTYF